MEAIDFGFYGPHEDGLTQEEVENTERAHSIYESATVVQSGDLVVSLEGMIDDVITDRLMLMENVGIPVGPNFYKEMQVYIEECFKLSIKKFFGIPSEKYYGLELLNGGAK